MSISTLLRFFFFQAEDGIRDFHVTGVQTCALPIYPDRQQDRDPDEELETAAGELRPGAREPEGRGEREPDEGCRHHREARLLAGRERERSEERRVGKECRARWAPSGEKKMRGLWPG